MIRFNCKSCEQRYKTDKDLAGDEIECNKCGGCTVNNFRKRSFLSDKCHC